MLSNDLESLRTQLNRHRDTGVALRPSRICDIVAILDAAIADAEALEACYVLTTGREATAAGLPALPIDDIPATVASLAAYRGRRAMERFFVPVLGTRPLPDCPDGGAA